MNNMSSYVGTCIDCKETKTKVYKCIRCEQYSCHKCSNNYAVDKWICHFCGPYYINVKSEELNERKMDTHENT